MPTQANLIGTQAESQSESFARAYDQSQPENQAQSLLVLMSSTSAQFLDRSICHRYNRCGRSDCLACQTFYQGKKTKEVTKNIRDKDLIRLILTINSKSNDNLNDLLTNLYESFKRLRRTVYWRDNIHGGLARLHVDHSGESWHPHFDLIAEPIAALGGIEEATLSTLWESITKGSHYVHIQAVTPTELSHLKLTTYILKPTFKSIADKETLMADYSCAVKKRKKLQRFGTWVNTKNRKDWVR